MGYYIIMSKRFIFSFLRQNKMLRLDCHDIMKGSDHSFPSVLFHVAMWLLTRDVELPFAHLSSRLCVSLSVHSATKAVI